MSRYTEVWFWEKQLVPILRGKWWRMEVVYPDGFPDSMGLWDGRTWYLEHKIGEPSLKLLRPGQHEFHLTLIERGLPSWCVFHTKQGIRFFENLDFSTPRHPEFVRARPASTGRSPLLPAPRA